MNDSEKAQALDSAAERAARYEKTCTGCAQSVVAGVLDALGLASEDLFKAASGLADGIGLTGEGSCGALTGGAMMIGFVCGRERKDHQDVLKPMKSYLLCRELANDFKEQYGSVRCHDLQIKLMGRTFNMLDPKDLKAAAESGMMEHCSKVVGRAARKTAELILRDAPIK